ncbi:MAG: [FeFe] hydrogenase H-cluster radical SAM maturase HydG [Deltaproteobacteria bacterium]|nr:[FeFe] hydrogenase H-cluster radical SAM maturase HydG [Deltaproteobacteria bacterium]
MKTEEEKVKSAFRIPEEEIQNLLQPGHRGGAFAETILEQSRQGKPLDLLEAAVLLSIEEPALIDRLYETAREVKERVFGKRIVLFAPLYISNRCVNNCLYCGFRRENREAERKTLPIPGIVEEARALYDGGYRRVLLVAGEGSGSSIDYLCDAVSAIYRETPIRIVHVNAAPMDEDDFRRLKGAGAGVYQCFQETYHPETYARMHPSGPKSDYERRLSVMDRAVAAGFGDVGMGALFGLYDDRFEVLALIAHARYLEERFGVGPHTVSVPRLQPAAGSALQSVPCPVSDEAFKKIVAVFRLAVPYAGVVVSTREGAALRDEVIRIGVSQISAGSRTDIGGYAHAKEETGTAQFSLSDGRNLDEVIAAILDHGLEPSLCTACYRSGRTGEAFRAVAESGRVRDFCEANALFSLMEYFKDHGTEKTRAAVHEQIVARVTQLKDDAFRREVEKGLDRVARGEEDVHF